jgi:carbamoylphosphate synthase small subunit
LACVLKGFDIGIGHQARQLSAVHGRNPTELRLGAGGISDECVDLRRAKVALIEPNVGFPVKAGAIEGDLKKFTNRYADSGR